MREHQNSQYSMTSYFLAKQLADVPFEMTFTARAALGRLSALSVFL
jgi:hypothetical protein